MLSEAVGRSGAACVGAGSVKRWALEEARLHSAHTAAQGCPIWEG